MPFAFYLRPIILDKFIEKLLEYNPNYDVELLDKAYQTAKKLHEGQFRKSGEPYIIHPMAVAEILAQLKMDDVGVAAGLLHDVVEDTVYTLEDCRRDFGDEIALIVDGVTKLKSLNYESEKDSENETIRKMFLAMSKDIRVLIIKLADRLHNMRTIDYMTPQKIKQKSKETLEVYSPLAARLGMYAYKFELEDIAFKGLEPEAYEKLKEQLDKKAAERICTVDVIIAEIKKLIADMNLTYEIYGRNKHMYSIYKKMQFQHKSLDEIFDLTAVRVIVPTVRDCYAVLGAVHTRWTPIPGRFKDYIAMPKSNNYQSLHTTVLGDGGQPFEVQIRTYEMHYIAEYGFAAHWKYKEHVKQSDEESKLAWLRQTLEWQKDIKDSGEFVEAVKVDLFSNQVFVFTPRGRAIELPAGSTPLDFAFKIHTDVGYKCVGAKVNGKIVPIDYQLKNGEIVDILTSPNSKGPKADWLKIVKTSSAKNRIRQFLKKENKSETADKGKDALVKATKRKGYNPDEILLNKYVEKAYKAQNYSTLDDLYTACSYGGSALNRTILLCASYYHEDKQASLIQMEKEEARREAQAGKPRKNTKGVSVKGVSDLLIHYAKCCNPVPGDDIIGFTTKGRGVSIHRADCVNMASLSEADKARCIDVEWESDNANSEFDAKITIICDDRKGLIADISRICEQQNINISGITTKSDAKAGISSIELLLSITSLSDLATLQNKFSQIRGVLDVYRI